MSGPGLTCVRRPPRPRAGVDPYAHSACRGKKPRLRGAAHILLARQAVEDDDPGRANLWRHRMWQRGKREQCSGKCSTIRHRAKSTAGTGRIGHGSATRQTANLCGKLHCASPPRLQGRTGAPNLGDDSGRHEDLGTTERPFGCPEITERRIPRRETRPRGMRSTSVKLTQGIKRSWIGMDASDGPTWNSLRDLCSTNGQNLRGVRRFPNA